MTETMCVSAAYHQGDNPDVVYLYLLAMSRTRNDVYCNPREQ